MVRLASGRKAGYDTLEEVYTIRTSIVLDDALVEEAMRLSGVKSKREIVDRALRDWLARHHLQALLVLVGRDLFDPGYDVRKVRAGMTRDFG